MVPFGEGDNATSMCLGNAEGIVIAFHVADKHFIKVLYACKDLFKILRSIVRIDDH